MRRARAPGPGARPRGALGSARVWEAHDGEEGVEEAGDAEERRRGGGGGGGGAWPGFLRWKPTSPQLLIEAERRLLSTLVKTPYVQERVDIGPGPPAIKFRLFSQAVKTRYINTVTFDKPGGGSGGAPAADKPVLVMVHGYGAAQGFFFRNFDALADHFRVHAIDQLGWGGSSRPAFVCKSTEETESWFVDSLEDWRKAKGIDKFVLLGHSFGGYISARYALKHPERVQRLILVGTAGFAPESDKMMKFRGTFKGQMLSFLWNANTTPQSIIRFFGPLGPRFVLGYTSNRFGEKAQGLKLTDDEAPLFTDYMYHTLAGQASGEMCLKHLFSLGAFARRPLVHDAHDFKMPTSFIYGTDDWMNYRAGYEAAQMMEVDVDLMRVPQGGHYIFLDNAPGFLSAVLNACREILPASVRAALIVPPDQDYFEVPVHKLDAKATQFDGQDVNGHSGPTKEAETDVETFRPESPRIHRWGRQVSSSWRFG
eukprot:SM000088S23752  [mRNA]  locus=s88:469039:471916:+ [translate_table: standard]